MFFFRSQFSFWAFPHQSLCLCCPGAWLQRKGVAVPFFPVSLQNSAVYFLTCQKADRSIFTLLVVVQSVDVTINYLLFRLCSCSPLKQNISPLQIIPAFSLLFLLFTSSLRQMFFSQNIVLSFLLSSSSLPSTKYFPSLHNNDGNFTKSFALFTWSIFSFRFSTPTTFPSCLPLSTTVQW